MRKIVFALLVLAAWIGITVVSALPARATCQPGSIGLKPKPHIELPRCEPFPQ